MRERHRRGGRGQQGPRQIPGDPLGRPGSEGVPLHGRRPRVDPVRDPLESHFPVQVPRDQRGHPPVERRGRRRPGHALRAPHRPPGPQQGAPQGPLRLRGRGLRTHDQCVEGCNLREWTTQSGMNVSLRFSPHAE